MLLLYCSCVLRNFAGYMFCCMLNFVLRLYFSSIYRITVELLRYGFYIHEHLDVFITVLVLFITTSTATVYTRYTCCL